MRLHLIGCSVLIRELSDAIVHSPHIIDARYLPAGLHDTGAQGMHDHIQQAIDEADFSHYDAILLGYGLCGNGLVGLRSKATPLVVPRAHDCITLLMGSRARYRAYFEANAGVYFRSVGWVERGAELEEQLCGLGFSVSEKDLVAKYGEEAGRYLYEEFNRYRQNYRKLTYIRTMVDADAEWSDRARSEAKEKGWEFEEMEGDNSLFRRLLSGEWEEDFLVAPPGHGIASSHNEDILTAKISSDFR